MATQLATCPKCGHNHPDTRGECAACGVIFAKIRPHQAPTGFGGVTVGEDVNAFQRMIGSPSRLYIEQNHRHWWEILLNWEQRNEYSVSDGNNRLLGWIVEQGKGFGAALLRVVAGSHRPFEIAVVTTEQEHVLDFRRAFFFLFSSMEVASPSGRLFGKIHRRFALLKRVYDLEDAHGHVFARVESPLLKFWTFPVIDEAGSEAAMIAKKWSGLTREYFTDADNFGVDFGTRTWSDDQRAVILAAAIAIDFDFFENNQQR